MFNIKTPSVMKSPSILKRRITKFYRLQNPDGSVNSTTTRYVTDPLLSTVYRGIKNQFMCRFDYVTPTTDILTFEGHRTPGDDTLGIPSLYKETLTINSVPYNKHFICASANYVDTGNGFETTTNFIDYTVLGASGKYKGYNRIRIYFDNVNFTRIVYINQI
jgi:hypothetical protein